MNQVVPVNKAIVIGITQLISNTSGKGAQYTERAARMWKYQCDYQLRTIMKEAWKAGETQVGLKVKWACNTSKLGPPGMTIDSYLRFGVGFDRLYEVINLGLAAGIIKRSGAWASLSFLLKPEHRNLLDSWKEDDEAPKFCGAEKLYEAVLAVGGRPEWAAACAGVTTLEVLYLGPASPGTLSAPFGVTNEVEQPRRRLRPGDDRRPRRPPHHRARCRLPGPRTWSISRRSGRGQSRGSSAPSFGLTGLHTGELNRRPRLRPSRLEVRRLGCGPRQHQAGAARGLGQLLRRERPTAGVRAAGVDYPFSGTCLDVKTAALMWCALAGSGPTS
jgi:hypothetical protein